MEEYIVQLVDSRGSIVRTYETNNINEANLKAKLWSQLFNENYIYINNVYFGGKL